MQHRRIDHLGHVGAVQRRTRILRIGDGEADLVVDDDVNRAADAEAARLRHIHQFHVDALPGQRGVAVDQHRQHLLVGLVLAPALACAHRTGDHRVDDLQMRGIEGEGEMHGMFGRLYVRIETHVILHVAGMRRIVGVIELALELGKEFLRRLAERVDQHIQTTAMGHADDHVAHAIGAAAAHQFVEQRNQAVAAFQRKAFLADVFGVQITFQSLGLGQQFQRVFAFFRAQSGLAAAAFELFVHPAPLFGIADVHEFGADGVGVSRLEQGDQILEFQPRRPGQRAGVELGVEIGGAEAMEGRVEIGRRQLLRHAQRIQIGGQMSARTIGRHQLEHGGLLLCQCVLRLRVADRCGRNRSMAVEFLCLFDARDGIGMRHIAGFAAAEGIEVFAPFRRDRIGITQVVFVEFLDEPGITAGKLGRFCELLE